MEVKVPGHSYGIHTAKGFPAVDIIFCKMENGEFWDGITNEELVEVLIHRMSFMVQQKPSQENMNALTHLRQTKQWMNVRNLKKIQNRKNDNAGTGIQLQVKS